MRRAWSLILVALLAGCADSPAGESAPGDPEHKFSGAGEGSHTFTIAVGEGAVGLLATLESSTIRAFSLELRPPDGGAPVRGGFDIDGRLVAAPVQPPVAGEWVLSVRGTPGAGEFSLTVADQLRAEDVVVAREVTLAPGAFAEYNFILEEGARVRASFGATGSVVWDLHSHDGSRVTTWKEGTGPSGEVELDSPRRDLYSLSWVNRQGAPATVSFRAEGPIIPHSLVG